MWTWRTAPDGSIEVLRDSATTCPEFAASAPTGEYELLTLPNNVAVTAALARVLSWSNDAAEYAAEVSLPLHWVLAFIYAESLGHEEAFGTEPDGSVGVGLMALTAKPGQPFQDKFGITVDEARQGRANIRAGTKLMRTFYDAGGGLDLPQLASAYNGGMKGKAPWPSERSAWGMREYCGKKDEPVRCCHIERVVRAANVLLVAAQGPLRQPPPVVLAAGVGGGTAALVAFAAAAGGYFLARRFLGA